EFRRVLFRSITLPNGLFEKLYVITRFFPPFLYSAGDIPSMCTNKSCNRLVLDNPVSKVASNKVACSSRNNLLAYSTLVYCKNFFGLVPAHSVNMRCKYAGL